MHTNDTAAAEAVAALEKALATVANLIGSVTLDIPVAGGGLCAVQIHSAPSEPFSVLHGPTGWTFTIRQTEERRGYVIVNVTD
jgi:hypothetical protein